MIMNVLIPKLFNILFTQVDKDVFITNSYETAMRTAQNFLSVFLKKLVFLSLYNMTYAY